MRIDTHAHIYSEDEAAYPVIENPLRPPEGTGSPAQLRELMSSSGVDRVMMVQTSTFYGWDNTFVRDTVPASAPWARGVYTLNPQDPHSPDVLYALVERSGMKALRTYNIAGDEPAAYDHPGNRRLWDAARENGTVVNVLINHERYATELASFLRDYPEVNAVLDHCIALDLAEPNFPAKLAAVKELAQFPNMHAKLTFLATGSGEEYPFADTHSAAREIIDAYGPDRCVWGSDFPLELWAPKTTYEGYLRLFQYELGLSSGEQWAILGDTAESLYFS